MSPSLAELLDLVTAIGGIDNGWGIDQVNAYRDKNFPGVDITRLRPQMTRKAASLALTVKQEFARQAEEDPRIDAIRK